VLATWMWKCTKSTYKILLSEQIPHLRRRGMAFRQMAGRTNHCTNRESAQVVVGLLYPATVSLPRLQWCSEKLLSRESILSLSSPSGANSAPAEATESSTTCHPLHIIPISTLVTTLKAKASVSSGRTRASFPIGITPIARG
jgi:hypothetical protein